MDDGGNIGTPALLNFRAVFWFDQNFDVADRKGDVAAERVDADADASGFGGVDIGIIQRDGDASPLRIRRRIRDLSGRRQLQIGAAEARVHRFRGGLDFKPDRFGILERLLLPEPENRIDPEIAAGTLRMKSHGSAVGIDLLFQGTRRARLPAFGAVEVAAPRLRNKFGRGCRRAEHQKRCGQSE